ncbi:hypothetical protein JXA84_01275 [candidate division WOR-3 bacterium]|nr:hypothetical protein [candidate division WOR-3 bacterium]
MSRETSRLLETAFNFTADDLYTNRNGLLSDEQKKRIESLNKSTNQRQITSMLIALFIVGLSGLIYYNKTGLQYLDLSKLWPFLIYIPILIIPMTAYYIKNKNLREGKISIISGSAQTSMLSIRKRGFTQIKIEGVNFLLSQEQADILKNGYFTVYYVKTGIGNRILSIDGG